MQKGVQRIPRQHAKCYRQTSGGRYSVQITIDGKIVPFGTYDLEVQAQTVVKQIRAAKYDGKLAEHGITASSLMELPASERMKQVTAIA